MTVPFSSGKSFAVPEYLQNTGIGVTGITLDQRNLIINFNASKGLKGQIKILVTGNWEADRTALVGKASHKGFMQENIELMVKAVQHIYAGEAADSIAFIKERVKREVEAQKLQEAAASDSDAKKKPHIVRHFLQKYHNPHEGNELYEAVLVGGDAYFVAIDRDSDNIQDGEGQQQHHDVRCRLEAGFEWYNQKENTTTKILPKENLTYVSRPYQYESQAEIDTYLNRAQNESLDSLYQKVKTQISKYIDAPSDAHITILSADCIFTYFQDNFGLTHYLFFYGDNGSGKTINLMALSILGYRAMFDVDITDANIYTYYGSVEEGQGIILEDEVDGMEFKYDKMKLYKRGNMSGGRVSRTETGGDTGRRQDGFFVYGFKAFSGEQKLDADKAKGFNERTFYLECQEGDPRYDLSEVINPAGDESYETLLSELVDLHKLLLAYRLIHHTDKIPNIDVMVKNREKQLTKPLLRLFQKAECRDEIGKALAQMIAIRRGVKKDTLEAAIFDVIWGLVQDDAKTVKCLIAPGTSGSDEETYDIEAKRIYDGLAEALGGTRAKDTQQSYDTPQHGQVSFKAINRICIDRFGAKKPTKKQGKDGVHLVFDVKRLLKVKSAYDLTEEGIKIVEESGREERKTFLNSLPDASYASDGSTEGVEGNGEIFEDGNRQESAQTVESSQQKAPESEKTEVEGAPENSQNRGVPSTELSEASEPSEEDDEELEEYDEDEEQEQEEEGEQ